MIFTILYMYATVLQWWRLGSLKNKLNGTLSSQNALLVCDESIVYDTRKLRSFENLLFRQEDRIGCTVVPRQKINLSHWVCFPKDYRYFPIYFTATRDRIESPNIYVLVQAMLDSYVRHSAASLQVEQFGELVAWKVTDYFEAILKTDIDKLTKLVHCYSQSPVDINHELKLLKIETVDVEGVAAKLRYERKFPKDNILKFSYAPVHWKKFVESLKEIYAKLRDSTNPKIMIENGAAKSEDVKKVPVSEVKPIKKDSKKSEDKNTLEVGSSDFRRHKSGDHKRDKIGVKADTSKIEKCTEQKHKDGKIGKTEKETKKEEKYRKKDEDVKKESKDGPKLAKEHAEGKKIKASQVHRKEDKTDGKTHKKERDPTKLERARSKADLEIAGKSNEKPPEHRTKESKNITKRTTSSEKKLVKSVAVCEDNDVLKDKNDGKDTLGKAKDKLKNGDTNGHQTTCNGSLFTKYKGVKPPNVLVYADSVVAKENVKEVLSTMLNKEKYTIYDLPTTPNQTVWNGSTILVVVCGTVPPNLTFHLLQYLLSGGQLLCLCSDLLYSVLHTFTTAEVREHELVRFNYGKWRQVKMMHHIFCYQASPAKKQFSKDSDHSNQSSGNGSSPIAPRTPSAVEIQHNGKDYTIQVQVLGTEETWQTPSLLLATVKDGEGRAIFSQVHLEIDPNEYEDDENKFTALKDSDQARMEILRDILSNHLDIDCTSAVDVTYAPAYFLGRHDLKLSLLSDCEHIKENTFTGDKLTIKFCGKDEKAETPSSSFLPVFIHSCPSNFSTVNYFEALETEHIGRLVLYCDVLGSSQTVLSKNLRHGLVVIPRQQTQGIGRSSNVWISPIGSANFSLQLHIPMASPLYKYLPLTQQIVMVGVVHALKKFNGCQDLQVGIKWPNDLYANGNVKIGGLLATSFVNGDMAVINIGCGINLDNSNPTTCVNDLIREANADREETINTIPYEAYFAAVFNETEKLLNSYQKGDPDSFFDLYYKYWLHNNSVVTITSKEGEKKKARVVGIDEFGFLKGQNLILDNPFAYSMRNVAGSVSERIIGGQEAAPHAYPYQVGLYCQSIELTNFCGGSLVSKNFILTAAHCLDGVVSVDIVLGAHFIEENEDTQVRLTSDDFVIHPGWDKTALVNDIALIKLKEPVSENQYIGVVKVASGTATFAGREGLTTGWGKTANEQSGVTSQLRYVVSYILTNDNCKSIDPYGTVIQPTHLCLSGLSGSARVGDCNGDFGGPLVAEGTQVGVASFGYKDCGVGKPDVFTRLTEYTDWIRENSDVDV